MYGNLCDSLYSNRHEILLQIDSSAYWKYPVLHSQLAK